MEQKLQKLPLNLDYSIKITKNKIPTVSDPYITVEKIKKAYECGDTLNTDDLTVTYYNSDGTAETVTDYTTNANEIDMSVQGTKILTVTYNGLTAEVELTVTSSTTTDPDKENYKVTFDLQGHGTALEEYSTYTAIPKGTTITRPTPPEAEGYQFTGWYKDPDCKTLWDFEKDTIEEDTTLYAGWKSNSGSDDDNPPEDIPDGIWIAQIKDYTYTGKPIIPSVVVYFNKKRLTAGQDYTITYKKQYKSSLSFRRKSTNSGC